MEIDALEAEWDAIVVGGGGSGLAAARSIAEHGGRVVVFEKEPQPGGTTGIAIGSFTAANTRIQHAARIVDDPSAHAEDAAKFAAAEIEARNNGPLREYFLEEASATLDWLREMGLSFVGPSPEPPNRVARMHNVVPGAKAYIAAFQVHLRKLGAPLCCGVSVDNLIFDGDRVGGVRVSVDGKQREFYARGGVVLAGGDYANNPDLIAVYKGEQYRDIEGINPHATGAGHELAMAAGARMVNMDVTYGPELRFVPSAKKPFQQWLPASGRLARIAGAIAPRLPSWLMRKMIKRLLVTWQHPENSLFEDGAILINRQGDRFVDERLWPDREIQIARQDGKVAYIVLDERLINAYSDWPNFISTAPDIAYAYVDDYARLRPDVTTIAARAEDVFARRGIQPAAGIQAIKEVNQSRESPHRLRGDRWCLLGPVKAYFTTTEGGAAINSQLRVLDESDRVIPGLYAVGQNGLGGMILWGHGLHIAWALTSGRLVGPSLMASSAIVESI